MLGARLLAWRSGVMAAFFLVLEGMDGVGKTRLAQGIRAALASRIAVELTQEPRSDCCAGIFLRKVLRKEREADTWTQALAFAANRADHNARVIEPFLREHTQGLLISDRYYLSSLVYQARDAHTFAAVLQLNARARRPDLTLFLDAPPNTLAGRQRDRSRQPELYDGEMSQTRARYEKAMTFLRDRGESIAVLAATATPADLLQMALQALRESGPPWLNLS